MFLKIRGAYFFFSRVLLVVAQIATFLVSVGFIANFLVVATNDWRMPEAMHKDDVLFVLWVDDIETRRFHTAKSLDGRHQALTEKTHLRILSDRVSISFQFIDPNALPRWCYKVLEYYQIEPGQNAIASVGDLLMWSGVFLTLPTLPMFFIELLWSFMLWIKKKI